jgi:hypothetical protein
MMVRIVDGLVGTVAVRTHIAPRMGSGKDIPTLRSAGGRLVAAAGGDELRLSSDVNLSEADRTWTGESIITVGEWVTTSKKPKHGATG